MTGNKILCIEDETEIRQIIVEELTDAGYQTLEADSGKTGLAAIMAGHPDLVLCDMNMPEMDGNQLLQTLRADHPDFADMPFIFLTAQTDRGSMLNGKKLGADDYLTKPIDFELLLVTLEARLGQVLRMEAKQEQQLVKLYKTVSGCCAAAPPIQKPAMENAVAVAAGAVPATGSQARDRVAALSNPNNGRVTAGRLQFIGMDAIRDELGDRWPAFADRVFDIAERTISKRMAEHDVFSRDENDNFVICFAGLDETEGAFKADRIAEEVREKILGAPEETEIHGESDELVFEAPASAPLSSSYAARASQALTAEAHSIPLTFEEAKNSDSVFDLVLERLDQVAALRRKAEQTTLRDIFESCLIRMQLIEMPNSSLTPFRLAHFDESTQMKIDALMAGQQCVKDFAAEIDMLRLAQVAQKIYESPEASKSVAIVELNFATIDLRRNQDRIVKVLQSLKEPVPSSLALMISGIPGDIYPSRMTALINLIRPYCRLVVVELGRPVLENIEPSRIQAPMVSCNFKNLSVTLAKNPEKIRALTQEIKNQKARFLVHSVPNIEQKSLLAKLGTDLFCMS